jgi:FlaA1/EpsC-like NDP-sugar epimerase
LYHIIKKKSNAPRWIIFIIDLSICAFSILYANLLRFNFDVKAVTAYHPFLQILTVIAVSTGFFFLFRTYVGIIRTSGIKEGVRCITVVFYSCLLLFIANLVSDFNGWHIIIPNSILLIYFFTASFLIFGYRLLAKDLYFRSIKAKIKIENVIIFGGAKNGTLLKNAMEQMSFHQYNVAGFIETNKKLWGKTIDNIKIYSFEQIKKLTQLKHIKLLFLADENIEPELKNEIVNYCLSQNIEVKIIPPVQNWIQGQLMVKQLQNVKIEDLLNRPVIKLTNDHVSEYLKEKRILITGAGGSIGSEITRLITTINPTSIMLCDQAENGLYELEYQLIQKFGKKENIKMIIGDVTDKESMEHLFITFKPEVVFHAAAYKHVPLMEKHPSAAVKNNILGTKILADLSETYSVERFVLISTDKAINPTNVMGATKRIAEMYIGMMQHKNKNGHTDITPPTKYITTRFGNVLDSSGSVIPRFKQQIEKGGPVTVTHPDIIRYFMTIPEACSLVLEACSIGNGGEIFVFDMGEPVKILDLANTMIKLAGMTPDKDIKIEFTGLRPGEKLFEELLNKEEESIPTHHKKIMISKGYNRDFITDDTNINYLIELAMLNKNTAVVKQMKLMLPEYKSKNSKFEKLDKEITENNHLNGNGHSVVIKENSISSTFQDH